MMRPEECTEAGRGDLREAVQAARIANAKALRPQSSVLSRIQRPEWPERVNKRQWQDMN